MRQRCGRSGVVCLAALAAALLTVRPATAADEALKADRLLPANTYAYFSIPNVTEFKQKFRKSVYGDMRRDAALQPLWDQLDALLKEAGRQVESNIGIPANDLLAIPSGQFALAAIPVRTNKLGGIALLDFGKHEETVDRLLEVMAEKLDKEDVTRTVEEIEETRVIVYTFAEAKKPFNQFAYFVKGQTVVFGTELSVLQEVLKRWDADNNSSKTLAESDVYSEIREQTQPKNGQPLLAWYLDPIGTLKATVMVASDGNPQAALVLQFLPALGLDKLKGVGGAADLNSGGFDSVSRTMTYVDQPTSGLLNMFQFPAADLAPPKWVTADADTYFAVNWDAEAAYEAVQELYDTFPGFGQGPGAFEELMDQVAQQPPGLHPKKDVIDLLTGKILVVGDVDEPDDADDSDDSEEDDEDADMGQSYLVAVGVKDEAKARTLLDKLSKEEVASITSREFKDQTLYEIEASSPTGTPTTVTLGVAQGNILVTNDAGMLEDLIGGDDDAQPLAQSPEYKRIAAHFPKKASILSYQRQDVQAEQFYEMLKSGQLFPTDSEVDLSALPEFDDIRKYLPTTGGYTVPVEHGALSVSFSIRRPAPRNAK